MKKPFSIIAILSLIFTLFTPTITNENVVEAMTEGHVVINEIAWMGTNIDYNNEWIELYNDSSSAVSLDGWTLSATDGSPAITLSGTIPSKGYFLLERTDDNSVSSIPADEIYSGSLSNTGEVLELKDQVGSLVDSVDAWYAGDNGTKASMERVDPTISGTTSTNWVTATGTYTEGFGTPGTHNTSSPPTVKIAINEIAWMGTTTSYSNEWMELYNNTDAAVSLEGWTLKSTDGSLGITLSGSIPANGYYLLERTDDNAVSNVAADLTYSGSLDNTGETLSLSNSSNEVIDSVDTWYAGDNSTKATMERTNLGSGTVSNNWNTSTATYAEGYGTPKGLNSMSTSGGTDTGSGGGSTGGTTGTECTDRTEHLNNVSDSVDAINIYFNKCALPQYAATGNEANYNVNLENRLLKRLNEATTSIDLATYEINLPNVVDTLINKAAQGVDVRVIADAKDATDPNYIERYETMRLYVEKMVRGKDLVVGTADDIHVFSDSAMLAIEDSTKRASFGLPTTPVDFPLVTITVGNTAYTGYLFVDAEQDTDGSYYSPDNQMHNKFANIDNQWVFTGSWNYTVTGLYGTDENMAQGILDGNQNHVVEMHSPELASIYQTEFNEMWGSSTLKPDTHVSNFSSRKTDNTPHSITVGGKTIEIYFSPGDGALEKMANLVKTEADYSAYFTIFAWSDQSLVDELKYKWEGSYTDLSGTLTGFDVKGVFDSSFWNQWWSASIDMTGATASTTSVGNPNTRWANPAPVYEDAEVRKMHSKTMIIDVDTNSDPTVIIGSTNWSTNGNSNNDENMLIIHDQAITNQFVQEFYARYSQAGGSIPVQ